MSDAPEVNWAPLRAIAVADHEIDGVMGAGA